MSLFCLPYSSARITTDLFISAHLLQNKITMDDRGIPLTPTQSHLEEHIKEVEIFLNGDWQSSLVWSTLTLT